jgi:hypothetical protein
MSMNIDITSVIIGLVALAIFAIPITYDQMKSNNDDD